MSTDENEIELIRQLRKQGLSLKEIAKITGNSVSKVQKTVKDISLSVGVYHKVLPAALVQGTIINIETTGLDSEHDDIIAVGVLKGNKITVVLRVEANSDEFHSIVTEELSELDMPVYVWDAHFHEGFLLAKLHKSFELVDIFEPWKRVAKSKGLSYPTLDKLVSVPREYLAEEVVPEQKIRSLWNNYKKYHDKRSLLPINRHCMEDLRQALYILTFNDYSSE